MGRAAPTAAAAVEQLRQRGLLWGEDDQLHLVRPVREAFEPYPGGLAPPSARPMSVDQIDAAVDACGTEARAVLERLLWSPTGAVRYADRPVSIASARSPIERLLSHQLLRPLDSETVILPREVSWRLRDGRFTAEPVATEPPMLIGQLRDADLVDRAAAGAAFAVLHDIELLAHQLEAVPHKLLRGGGLANRDVSPLLGTLTLIPIMRASSSSARQRLSSWHPVVRARCCQLPNTTNGSAGMPQAGGGWLPGPGLPPTGSSPGRLRPAVTPSDRRRTPAARSACATTVLRIAEAVEPGTVLDLGQLADAAGWHRPRLTHAPLNAEQLVRWTWREGSWLGLAALGAVSSFAKLLLQPGQQMPDELKDLFPTPVKHFVIQTDLTAVAPGPLEHTAAAELRMLADQESRGGAGVYRFTATSLRGAFDQGWSAADVRRWLERHSTTGVPSLSLTSLTMWPGGTTASGSAPPAAMFACLTRRRLRRSLPTLPRRPLDCARSRRSSRRVCR